MMVSREVFRKYAGKDLPVKTIDSVPCLDHPNINNREKLLAHLFTPQELALFKSRGKMHILRNIQPSTLGYFCGEALVSITEPEVHRAELDCEARYECTHYSREDNPVANIIQVPIAVGYVLVQENSK